MNGSDVRLVPMTREQRHDLAVVHGHEGTVGEVIAAWDAAPSDPAEAVREALVRATDLPADERRLSIATVLAALGVPVEAKP